MSAIEVLRGFTTDVLAGVGLDIRCVGRIRYLQRGSEHKLND